MKFIVASVLTVAAAVSAQSAQIKPASAPITAANTYGLKTDRSTLAVAKPLTGDTVDMFCARTLKPRTCTDQSFNFIADCMLATTLPEAETRAQGIMKRSNKMCKKHVRELLNSGDAAKMQEAAALMKQFKITKFAAGTGQMVAGTIVRKMKKVKPTASPVAAVRKVKSTNSKPSVKSTGKKVRKSTVPGKFQASMVRNAHKTGTKPVVKAAPVAAQAVAVNATQAARQLTFFERISKAFKKLGKKQTQKPVAAKKATKGKGKGKGKKPQPTPAVVVAAPAPLV